LGSVTFPHVLPGEKPRCLLSHPRYPLAFEHSSAVVRDPDPDDLDSLATSHNHLVLRCGKPDADDTGQELRP
jgi:hypothetical protein